MTDVLENQEIQTVIVENETSRLKEQLSPQEIWEKCLTWHDTFDSEVWNNKDSFHNRRHIEAVVGAVKKYMDGCSRDDDPLELYKSLDLWNNSHPDLIIPEDELSEAIMFAIYTHDTGNIISFLSVRSGNIKPSFLPNYTAGKDVFTGKVAEERSQAIAEFLINNSNLGEEKKQRYNQFVKHLINETKYMPEDQKSPFSVFMRVMDQIGNDLFSQNERRLLGLIYENGIENPFAEVNPYFFVNFVRERFKQLVTDENDRQRILEIWGKNLPDEVNVKNEKLPINQAREIIQESIN